MPWFVNLIIAVALFTLPFLVGGALSRKLRMPEHGWKIGVVFWAIACAVVVISLGGNPKLGIDLSGGVIMVYEVDQERKKDTDHTLTGQEMEQLIAAVSRRINPGGVKDVTIRTVGPEQIEIIVPKADQSEVKRLETLLGSVGSLEFRILANSRDHKSIIERAKQEDDSAVTDTKGNVLAKWVPLAKKTYDSLGASKEFTTRPRKKRGKDILEILVARDRYDITGEYLLGTKPGYDERGQPCVNFSFNAAGARKFGGLTSENLPDKVQDFSRKLAIILNDEVHSAPAIRSTIRGRGEITGDFTQEEVSDLVSVLNAGRLPAKLTERPISSMQIGPTLGRDTIRKGAYSMVVSMILVLLFMLIYYRFSGVVACLALIANLLLIVGIMITIKAAFTLPGLAGLVLTIGMAVDANVLIFERIREELNRGAALRMAIRNGFSKATTTIIDANLTTLITATVLWAIGEDQIRGFAVVLWLGVVLSMFTAIFCSRIVFDIAEKKRWITSLHMMRIIGKTNIDFLAKRYVAGAISIVLIVIGLVCVGMRGKGLLDIDFTGGVSVEILFKEPQKIVDVRESLAKLEDLAVADVQIEGEEPGLRYVINTSHVEDVENRDLDAVDVVEACVIDKFGDKLAENNLTIKNVKPIEKKTAKPVEKPVVVQASEGMSADLEFSIPVSYDALELMVDEALATSSKWLGTPFELSNPTDDSALNTNWNIEISLPTDQANKVLALVQKELSAPYFPSSNKIGSKVAGQTQAQAITALIASLLFIVGYIWIRFQRVMFGLAAVVALVHDVLITLGMIALSAYVAGSLGFLLIDPFKISLAVLAAFLTIIGYSLNDTIVVFDRIREVRGKAKELTGDMINSSINQTLSRTLLTSVTTLFVVVILYMFGGQGIHAFAFSLVVGVVVGTYSSVFVASPVLYWMSKSSTTSKQKK